MLLLAVPVWLPAAAAELALEFLLLPMVPVAAVANRFSMGGAGGGGGGFGGSGPDCTVIVAFNGI